MNNRILIVDDTPSIHEDFKKILCNQGSSGEALQSMANSLFGKTEQDSVYRDIEYELDSAYQGEEAIKMITEAEMQGKGYSLVFMDVRMPPGLDGIKTISKIWQQFPAMEIVICTAYSDCSWLDIVDVLGPSDHLLVLKKPFDADEAQQMALAMTQRANNAMLQRARIKQLEDDLKQCKADIVSLKEQVSKNNNSG